MKRSMYLSNRQWNSRWSRFLRRLFGDETGAVMMEYVVLGLLGLSACVAGVIMLSGVISNSQVAIGTAVTGQVSDANTAAATTRAELGNDAIAADTSFNAITSDGTN